MNENPCSNQEIGVLFEHGKEAGTSFVDKSQTFDSDKKSRFLSFLVLL